MKVLIAGESECDELALRLLMDAVVGKATTSPSSPTLRMRKRGLAGLLGSLKGIIHYAAWNTDAEALAVVIDSDMARLHDDTQGLPCSCRRCELESVIRDVGHAIKSRARPLWVGVAVAVPQLEAWLLAHKSNEVGEAEWQRMDNRARQSLRSRLKRDLYGTDRPGLSLEITRIRATIEEIVANDGIELIFRKFPYGFGHFVQRLRNSSL